ncbi:MAG: M3 family oligoendopeptidase [Candidatus Marinamargulisbacteria bacterium]
MAKKMAIHWDLKELHTTLSVDETQPLLDDLEQQVMAFSSTYKGRVAGLSSKDIYSALVAYDELRAGIYKISQFAHLNYSVDMKDPDVLRFVSWVDEWTSTMGNTLLFFFLEIGAISDNQRTQWLAFEPNSVYAYSIQSAMNKHPYRLSESEEQWINLKDLNGCDALRKLYGEHTAQYVFNVVIDGEEISLNGAECRALRYHEDPSVRREAMALFLNQYKQDEHIMVHVFNSVIKDANIERQKRGYKHPMDPMNRHNDLPDDLVALLHRVTTESNTLVQEYYGLKKKMLGLDHMTLADIYAPITKNEPKMPWDEAKALVLDSFAQFDDEFYRFADDMFRRDRLDVFPSKTKRGGAFCSSSSPDVRPYVMLNYLGKKRDVATLAHELGHAIHAYYSSKQPLLNYHAILPICETASVFCEMIVMDALKKGAQTKAEKITLLSTQLEDIFATSHRQNMFSRFEQSMHEKITHQRLSGDELSNMYANELQHLFGTSVSIPPEYHWEWATIPHMLDVPFYVYSYNFGNLLVFGLYQLYLDEGVKMIPKLKRILEGGSSKSPVQLLGDEGIDILDPAFWGRSITCIESVLNELTSLVRS